VGDHNLPRVCSAKLVFFRPGRIRLRRTGLPEALGDGMETMVRFCPIVHIISEICARGGVDIQVPVLEYTSLGLCRRILRS